MWDAERGDAGMRRRGCGWDDCRCGGDGWRDSNATMSRAPQYDLPRLVFLPVPVPFPALPPAPAPPALPPIRIPALPRTCIPTRTPLPLPSTPTKPKPKHPFKQRHLLRQAPLWLIKQRRMHLHLRRRRVARCGRWVVHIPLLPRPRPRGGRGIWIRACA
jgi:hypothetical protein